MSAAVASRKSGSSATPSDAIELGSGDDVELRHRRETLARHTALALRWPTRPAAPKTTSAGATGTANSMIE